MTLDPFPDEAAQLLERTLRHLEHQVGAAQSSALVLTLECLPDQAAAYLSRAALLDVQLGQLRRSPASAFAPDIAR
jgi:hypothetical protein